MRFSHDDGTRHLEFGSRVRDPEFGKLSSIGAVISEKKFALPVECLCEQEKIEHTRQAESKIVGGTRQCRSSKAKVEIRAGGRSAPGARRRLSARPPCGRK